MNYVKGFDISYHQDKAETPTIHIDFNKAKQGGCSFTIIRSSIGLTTDRDFQLNRVNAKQVGLIRGFYHFLTWPVSGKTQANYFYNLVKNDLPDFLVVDFEKNYMVDTPKTAIILLKDFLTELQKLYTGKIIIYTGAFFWNQYGSKDKFFTQFPLWIASYTNQAYMESNIEKLTPWETWDFWQFTSKGKGIDYGVESESVDLDYFNGTEEELKDFCGLSETEEKTDIEKLNILWNWYIETHK